MMLRLMALTVAGLVAVGGVAAAAPGSADRSDPGALTYSAQADDTAYLSGIQLLVRAGLDRETSAQSGIAALTAETIVRTPVAGGAALRDAVTAGGGSLTYTIEPQAVRFYLEAPPAILGPLVKLVAAALAKPDTSAPAIGAARTALLAQLVDDDRNPVAVGVAMFRQSYYVGGAGLPALGTSATLAGVSGADVRAFLGAHYLRGDAFVTAVGNVGPGVAAAAQTLAGGLPAGDEAATVTTVHALPEQPRRIVTQRDIGVPYLVLGFAAPALADKDFGTMLVLRSLLADVFDRPSATTLPAFSRGVGVMYDYETKPATFALSINGAQLSPAAGLGGVDAVLKGLAAKPFAPALLKRYKGSARGEWQTESVSLADRAYAIGTLVAQGLDPGYAQTALAAIDAVSAADVQRVAKAYLQRFTVAYIAPRSADPNS